MKNIVTVTFSPCIDKSTSVPSLMPEVKLKCALPKLEPGGGGINIARVIKKLGGNPIAVYPAGGYTGESLNCLMDMEAIHSIVVEIGNETRENVIVLDSATHNQYRFGMPGAALEEKEWKECLKKISDIEDMAYLIASGSLPDGVPLDVYAQLAEIARRKHAKLVVDTSGEALRKAIGEGVYLVKPSLKELAFLVNKDELRPDEIKAIAQSIIQNSQCEVMLVSMGAAGAILVTKDAANTIFAPPVIKKSTVGAGDSMVAGVVFSLMEGNNLLDAAQYGVACGTAATINHGTALCSKEDADLFYRYIKENTFSQRQTRDEVLENSKFALSHA